MGKKENMNTGLKALVTGLGLSILASTCLAETQKIANDWMDELTLYDVVWENDAPAYQHWLLDNYETAEEAGEWRINKLKAAYKFNKKSYPGNDNIWLVYADDLPFDIPEGLALNLNDYNNFIFIEDDEYFFGHYDGGTIGQGGVLISNDKHSYYIPNTPITEYNYNEAGYYFYKHHDLNDFEGDFHIQLEDGTETQSWIGDNDWTVINF